MVSAFVCGNSIKMQSAKSRTATVFRTQHACAFCALRLCLGNCLDALDRALGRSSYQLMPMMLARNLVLTATSVKQRVSEMTERGIARSHVNTGGPVPKFICHDVSCSAVLWCLFWIACLARMAPLHPPIWMEKPAMSVVVISCPGTGRLGFGGRRSKYCAQLPVWAWPLKWKRMWFFCCVHQDQHIVGRGRRTSVGAFNTHSWIETGRKGFYQLRRSKGRCAVEPKQFSAQTQAFLFPGMEGVALGSFATTMRQALSCYLCEKVTFPAIIALQRYCWKIWLFV